MGRYPCMQAIIKAEQRFPSTQFTFTYVGNDEDGDDGDNEDDVEDDDRMMMRNMMRMMMRMMTGCSFWSPRLPQTLTLTWPQSRGCPSRLPGSAQ